MRRRGEERRREEEVERKRVKRKGKEVCREGIGGEGVLSEYIEGIDSG